MLQGIRPAFKFNVVIVSIYLIKRGENMFKKIITAVLATLMICWCLPMNVYAQETTANAEQALRGPVCPFDRYTVVVSRNYETNWGANISSDQFIIDNAKYVYFYNKNRICFL